MGVAFSITRSQSTGLRSDVIRSIIPNPYIDKKDLSRPLQEISVSKSKLKKKIRLVFAFAVEEARGDTSLSYIR